MAVIFRPSDSTAVKTDMILEWITASAGTNLQKSIICQHRSLLSPRMQFETVCEHNFWTLWVGWRGVGPSGLFSVQNSASIVACSCIGAPIRLNNAGMFWAVRTEFFQKDLAYFNKTMPNHILHVSQHNSKVKEYCSLTELPLVLTRNPLKMFDALWKSSTRKETCWTA